MRLFTQPAATGIEKPIEGTQLRTLLSRVLSFTPSERRSLSLFDICVTFALMDRNKLKVKLNDIKHNWAASLKTQRDALLLEIENSTSDRERDSLEELDKLLQALEIKASWLASGSLGSRIENDFCITSPEPTANELPYGVSPRALGENPPWIGGQLSTIQRFLSLLLERGNDIEDLQQAAVGVDSMLSRSMNSFTGDFDALLFDPYIEWVRHIVSDTDELSLVGKQELVMNNRLATSSKVTGVSYYPFRNQSLRDQEIDTAKQLLTGLATNVNVGGAVLTALATPDLPPVFTHIAAGLDLSVKPTMVMGGREAHLDISLIQSVETDKHDVLEKLHIKPVSHIARAETKTNVSVGTYDLFELSTQTLQTTMRGRPTWSIPVLSDIPLVGKFLFRGPVRPVTKTQQVLMLVNTTVFPRAIDLVQMEAPK